MMIISNVWEFVKNHKYGVAGVVAVIINIPVRPFALFPTHHLYDYYLESLFYYNEIGLVSLLPLCAGIFIAWSLFSLFLFICSKVNNKVITVFLLLFGFCFAFIISYVTRGAAYQLFYPPANEQPINPPAPGIQDPA